MPASRCTRSAVMRGEIRELARGPSGMLIAETPRSASVRLSIARERDYKVGWAAMKYKIIYGIWPEAKDVEPARPSGEILWWIKKQNIAYAKARRAEEGEKPIKPALPDSPLMTEEDWQWLGR